MTAVLVARVREYGGDEAVAELLRRARIDRSAAELADISNWVSYDEATSLWRAGAEVTHHPDFARAVGEEAVRRLNGSPVATLLRSLGSPEKVYREITTTATKYSTVASLEAVACGPGFADIVATAAEGYPRSRDHCAWTSGLLSQPTVLFGLPPATVSHDHCAAFGAPSCRYRITWPAAAAKAGSDSSEQIGQLRDQLAAMRERLHSMFQTAADLIGDGDVDDVLSRIADRAAIEVRSPRHLLAVRMTATGELHCHSQGFAPEVVQEYAERLLSSHPAELPDSWLVVPIRSNRNDYGRLLATYDEGVRFFPQERELLEVYARYAASALDSATALLEARRRYGQSSALLKLARALAAAGTSVEVARRLVDSVPVVVDCDHVGVYLWDPGRGELVKQAIGHVHAAPGAPLAEDRASWPPAPGGTLEKLLQDPTTEPIFIDSRNGEPRLRQLFAELGHAATILVPLAAPDRLLGILAVAVNDRPERLSPSDDLLDRLSGVAAQATTALQNGRLVDLITHQALHDQLTGLANRVQFTTELRSAVHRARDDEQLAALFYLDLDRFKPVNDQLGHEAGDELLVAVAERLKSATRPTDIVARLGGDEFAMLLVSPAARDIDSLAQRIGDSFQAPFAVGGQELWLEVSVGRAVCPWDADDADGLLRQADAAMFANKRARQSGLLIRQPSAAP
jgi:diguanylate cyclase (GGDEF)-like protein